MSRLGQTVKIKGGGGGGEGPWYWTAAGGAIFIDGLTDDHVFVWADKGPTVTGPGSASTLVSGQVFLVTFTGDGTVVLHRDSCSSQGLLAHKPLV